MNKKELRLEAIKAALQINSPCAKPYDRVGDLIMNAKDILEFIETGIISKHEEHADQSLQDVL